MTERPRVGLGIIVIKKVRHKTYVLLHQRRGKLGTGYWGSGGGHLEHGESFEAAVLRELREEAGTDLQIKNMRPLGIINFTELAPKHYVDISYVAEWADGEARNESPAETSDWAWFALDALPEPLFPPVREYVAALKADKQLPIVVSGD